MLFSQFRQFYNLFFLLICISQIFPQLRIGFLITYIAPLIFVLSITLLKEAIDDIKRSRRDREINNERYEKLDKDGAFSEIASADIKVGDIIKLQEKKRIPADMILLNTLDKNGAVFIKTDQLDGETDWKLRKAIPKTQNGKSVSDLSQMRACVKAQAPHKDIYTFQGTFFMKEERGEMSTGLELENTVWANTVLANGTAYGLVIYTGRETKSQLNARDPRTKTGKIDNEISLMSFLLFILLIVLAVITLTLNGYKDNWYVLLMRYILLLSYIIPISLRVNLDLAKAWYSWNISSDDQMPGTIARSTTIPEELGRVQVLFSDKTGTLTKNEMKFKSLYVDNMRYDQKDSTGEIREIVGRKFEEDSGPDIDRDLIDKRSSRGKQKSRDNLVLKSPKEINS